MWAENNTRYSRTRYPHALTVVLVLPDIPVIPIIHVIYVIQVIHVIHVTRLPVSRRNRFETPVTPVTGNAAKQKLSMVTALRDRKLASTTDYYWFIDRAALITVEWYASELAFALVFYYFSILQMQLNKLIHPSSSERIY